MNNYDCGQCSKSFKKYSSLSRHMVTTHGVDSVAFFVHFYHNGKWPTCKCGCGKLVSWNAGEKKMRDYVAGHQSRVKNNWGHNPKAAEKSAETRRQQFTSGEREVWNKGLTSEMDDRVAINGKRVAQAFTDDRKRKYSDTMRRNRLDGTVPTLRGKDHSQWKGGTSAINVLVRARVKLYKEWKYPILCRDGFKCVECGDSTNLHVHHDGERMCEIIDKHIVDGEPKDFELKEAIADAVVEYHIKNKVSGVTLCGECHENKHPSLNFG
jgi:hypothetical protein